MMKKIMSNFANNNAKEMMKDCCSGCVTDSEKDFEVVKIEKTKNECALCEETANERIKAKVPFAILSCEGACLRGEVSRQAANSICFSKMPDKTSRICLGGAFTKNTGQRNLVRNVAKVFVLEGCYIKCASRMMKGVIEELNPEIIIVDRLYDFDKKLFGINEVTEQQIKEYAHTAAIKIVEKINLKTNKE
jgi:uncharacterized metal-binding protein